jgi:isopentenyldiphosphate isomerase
MTELYDYVDRDDNVIGQTTFDEARAQNRIIRLVHNWVVNGDGQILFQFRAAHKKNRPRHFDASVGGRVNVGEDYDHAVVRETREELGIQNVTPLFLGKVMANVSSPHKFVGVYMTHYDGPFSGWETEAECLEWMQKSEVRFMIGRFPYLFCQTPSLNLLLKKLER